MANLAGVLVKVLGRWTELGYWPVLQAGIGPDGNPVLFQASSSGGASLAFPSGTPTLVSIAASSNTTIPTGAKNWTLAILTGTGTVMINSVSVAVSAGYSQSSLTTLAGHTINVATDSGSTGVVYYES